MMQRIAFGVLCGLAFGIISVSADDKPVRVAGTVESFDGQMLAVKSSKLGEVKINLTADATVFGVARATLADVKPGSYVGIGAIPQADGSQRAVQVTVMAESQRGLSEGHMGCAAEQHDDQRHGGSDGGRRRRSGVDGEVPGR